MTRIGLLSDTHGFLDEKIFEYFEECDELWHAGDIGKVEVYDTLEAFKPIRAVYGNIDGGALRQQLPLNNRFEIEGMRVWMTHIAGYPGKYNMRVREGLQAEPTDIFVCGHSHILKVMGDKKHDHLHINPGACGNHGFHHMKTIIRFSIDAGEVKDMEVIELGLRGAIK